jgi:PAS domain S-box-containing protein
MNTRGHTRGDLQDVIVPGWALTTAVALLLALGCYLAQLLSITLRFPPTRLSTIWLPGGPLLATLLLAPPRQWWVLLSAAGVGLFAALAGDIPLPSLVAVVFVVCGSFAVVAAVVRRYAGGPPRFDRFLHVVIFVVISGIGIPALGALVVAGITVSVGWREGVWQVWPALGLMAMVGLVTVTPVIVVAATGGLARMRSATVRWWGEAMILGIGIVGVSVVAFGGSGSGSGLAAVWLLYAPLPLLLWAAVRFGAGGTSLSLLAVALISTANAVTGRGPFAAHSPADNVLSLQLSVIAMGVPLLFLAVVMEERRQTAQALAASEADAHRRLAELLTVYRTAPVGLALVDTDLRFVKVNDCLAEMDGRPASDHIGRTLREIVPGPLAEELEAVYREVIAKGRPALDLEIRGSAARPEVERVWLASYFPVQDESGQVLGVNTVVREVTSEKQAEERLRRSHDEVKDMAGRLIAAQEGERRRIARELHDDLTQRLAVLAIEVGKLERQPDGAEPVAAKLGGLRGQIVKLSEDVHRLSRRLHPSILDDLGLADALRSECAVFQEREGIEVRYRAEDVPADLPRDVSLTLYRIAQEGLRNAVRHSGAKRLEVSLTGCCADVLLTVDDDGKGFDRYERNGRAGIGLACMEERARLIGAELSIHSAPEKGTTVSVLVPRSQEPS